MWSSFSTVTAVHHNCDLQHSILILTTANYRVWEPEVHMVTAYQAVDVLHSWYCNPWLKFFLLLAPLIVMIVSYVRLDEDTSDGVKTWDLLEAKWVNHRWWLRRGVYTSSTSIGLKAIKDRQLLGNGYGANEARRFQFWSKAVLHWSKQQPSTKIEMVY